MEPCHILLGRKNEVGASVILERKQMMMTTSPFRMQCFELTFVIKNLRNFRVDSYYYMEKRVNESQTFMKKRFHAEYHIYSSSYFLLGWYSFHVYTSQVNITVSYGQGNGMDSYLNSYMQNIEHGVQVKRITSWWRYIKHERMCNHVSWEFFCGMKIDEHGPQLKCKHASLKQSLEENFNGIKQTHLIGR